MFNIRWFIKHRRTNDGVKLIKQFENSWNKTAHIKLLVDNAFQKYRLRLNSKINTLNWFDLFIPIFLIKSRIIY
jgi:hypothetical protein